MRIPHTPVLLNEVLNTFKDIQNGVILDCTLGYGGHSEAILSQNINVNVIACDKDDEAINFSKKRLEKFKNRIKIYKSDFSQIINQTDASKIRGILADIGVSSLQLDKNDRGFGLKSDTLDMRMDKTQELDAKFIVNNYSKSELERIFYNYAELVNFRKIADKIISARANKQIDSAKELAGIIGTKPIKGRSITPAILSFQAIRIEVNSELEELENLLKNIKNSKIDNAIVAIISFHSLEDRIVKNEFKKWERSCICPEFVMKCECGNNHCIGKILTKKAITPSSCEIKQNSRSSCAKMRVFKIDRN